MTAGLLTAFKQLITYLHTISSKAERLSDSHVIKWRLCYVKAVKICTEHRIDIIVRVTFKLFYSCNRKCRHPVELIILK